MRAVFGAIGLLASSGMAFAADPILSPEPVSGWTMIVKANVVSSPRFAGADKASLKAFPSLSFRRSNAKWTFSAPDDGISVALYDMGWLRAGVVGRFEGGRYYQGNRQIVGLHKIDWTFEGGTFLEFWPIEKLRARAELRRGFNGHQGVVLEGKADWVERFGAFTLALGPRVVAGNGRYIGEYFSVTPVESALNGFVPAFKAGSGLKSYGLAGSVSYAWDRNWNATLWARYDRLSGDAAKSPIVTTLGSKNQVSVGAILAYSFDLGRF